MAVWTVFLSTIELSPYSLTGLTFNLENSKFDWLLGLASEKTIQCSTALDASSRYT